MASKRRKRGFGQMRRLGSGRWQAYYTGPDATGPANSRKTGLHYAPTTFDTKLDAEAWLTDERRLIAADAWTPPTSRATAKRQAETQRRANTFATYASAWLDARHDLRPTTRASYRTALNRHLVPSFGDTPVDEISIVMVRAWFGSYGTHTPTARAHAYQVLAAIMAQAESDELFTRTPCRIKAGGRSDVVREPEVLTLAELLALADAMPQQHRALTLLCGLCGLRFGEAVALRRRDVDLPARVLHVVRGAVRAGGVKQVGPPKTAAGKRDVAMPDIVAKVLREHLSEQPVQGRDALVFPGKDGNLLAPSALYGRTARTERRGSQTYVKASYGFFAARETIGKPALHWHDLRRTAATLGAQSGATVREMQHRLGHTTPTMALRYQAATAERDRAIAARLQAQVEDHLSTQRLQTSKELKARSWGKDAAR